MKEKEDTPMELREIVKQALSLLEQMKNTGDDGHSFFCQKFPTSHPRKRLDFLRAAIDEMVSEMVDEMMRNKGDK